MHRLAIVSQRGAVLIINRKLKQTPSGDLVQTRLRLHNRNFNPRKQSSSVDYSPHSPCQPTCTRPSWTTWRARRSAQRGERETPQSGSDGVGKRRDVVCAVSQSDRGAVRDFVLSFFTLTTLQVYSLPYLFLKPSSPPALQTVKHAGHELA